MNESFWINVINHSRESGGSPCVCYFSVLCNVVIWTLVNIVNTGVSTTIYGHTAVINVTGPRRNVPRNS
jgi:hypothetical protein